MPNFSFTARSASGEIHKGTMSAHSKAEVTAALHSKQLQPIIVRQVSGKSMNMNISMPGSSGVKARSLVMFTRQFSTMINAGVPIMRALNILKEQTDSATLKNILNDVAADVQGGANLSDALAKHPKVFSSIYINMVRAGEAGGILDDVLKRLAYQQEKDAAIRSKIRSAMVYPSVIASVTGLAFFVLMTFIVPKIGAILTSLGGEAQLPIYTRALLAISDVMKQPAFIFGMIIGLTIAVVLFRRYIKTQHGRYVWHSFLLRVPIFKVIITKTAIARFSRIFSSLIGAGVPIIEAINTTAGAIGNAVIEKELLACAKAVQAGSQFSLELQKSKHFPPIVSQMLAVGEETGETDTVVLKVAEFYEEEVDTAIGSLSSVIEPVMIVVLGGMVGLIAISVFGPITQISTTAPQ